MFSLKTHDVYQEIQTERGALGGHECYIARLYTRAGEEKERIVGSCRSRKEAIAEACTELHKQFDDKYTRNT